MCARSCTHIYDVRKRKGVVIYLNVYNNNDIQNNDIYIFNRLKKLDLKESGGGFTSS